jgi:hypothetical protein
MSHRHANLLRSVFHDPVSGNIHWREVESLLHHVGVHLEPLTGARFRATLNGAEGVLHRPHHNDTLDRSGVKQIRDFLARAQVTPSTYEAKAPAAPSETLAGPAA